jgi:uncharacterized protein (TIGR02284 family)
MEDSQKKEWTMNDQQVREVLKKLYRIVEAGEKGFATSAANMPDPGIKALLKSYAQQRAVYKNEIMEQLRRYGFDGSLSSSIPAIIHRGRVAIFSAMVIDKDSQERVILKEAAFGERVALSTYRRELEKELPPPLKEMLSRQMEEISHVLEKINLLRGLEGRWLVVGLFEAENEAREAVQSLSNEGFERASIQQKALEEEDLYPGKGVTVLEAVLSGAFGGALWAGLVGILVGYGAARTTSALPDWSAPFYLTWLLAAIGFMGVGIIIGSVLAVFIGSGIRENDAADYHEIQRRANRLVEVEADEPRASKARQILRHAQPSYKQAVFKQST